MGHHNFSAPYVTHEQPQEAGGTPVMTIIALLPAFPGGLTGE
jgi:hypothetical protein